MYFYQILLFMYLRHPPALLRWILPGDVIWRLPESDARTVAITFDDGPDPVLTPQVLDILSEYQAKATFFCTGERLLAYPEIKQAILAEGHVIANHGHRHTDGWRSSKKNYLNNVELGSADSDSLLFRPPYGRIKPGQAMAISKKFRIVMWSLLSGDFDPGKSGDACLETLTRHTVPRDIVVFHDSPQAGPRLLYTLPLYLKYLSENSYLFEILR